MLKTFFGRWIDVLHAPSSLYDLVFTTSDAQVETNISGLAELKKELESRSGGLKSSSSASALFQVIINAMTSHSCSWPEDRIYAFLGLPSDPIWRSFSVDYSRLVDQTYLLATRYMIKSSRSIRVLSLVPDRCSKKVDNLPTWVPDFSVPPLPIPIDSAANSNFRGQSAISFKASYKILWDENLQHKSEIHLTVEGLRYITIDASFPRLRASDQQH